MPAAKRGVLWRFLAFAKPYRWWIAVVVVFGVGLYGLAMFAASITRVFFDEVIPNRNARLLWWLVAALAAIEIIRATATYVRGVCMVKLQTSVVLDVRQAMWKHLQRLSLGFHQSRPTGSLLSRLMSDINVGQQIIGSGLVQIGIDLISGVIAAVVLFSISWPLALLVLAILPEYGYMYRKVNPRIRQASRELQQQTSVMSGHAVERLNGIAVVQSFAQEPSESRLFANRCDELRLKEVYRGRLSIKLGAVSSFLIHLGGNSILIVGALLAFKQRITVGQIVQFAAVVGLLYGPVQRLSEVNIIYQTSMAAIERVFAIFDCTPAVQNRNGALDKEPALGDVVFDGVCFKYAARPPVLRDLNFTVAPGDRVAIVGESGAGKSTLVTLVPRLYDVTGGSIRIDGIDVRDYRLKRLRRSIGIVLQESILFSGTVAENLRYGNKQAKKSDIIEAAQAANAHDFIMELPEDYNTTIGERGLNLSGGQRQRLSLARTILQNPRVLILDEATSSLDSESENLITEALQRVMVGRTCLIIAHRLSTVIGADRLLVLKAGRLIEQGPHEELLAAGGYYRHIFEQQFGPLQELMARSGVPGGGEAEAGVYESDLTYSI